MKAKEYVEMFKKLELESDPLQAAGKTVLALLKEGEDLIEERKARKDSSVLSILKELNQKWIAICKIINSEEEEDLLSVSGFERYVEKEIGIVFY